MQQIKVLNLYSGIGGNRRLWENVDVTAVEINPAIADVYRDLYPNDNVVVGDAHRYLLEHYNEFDFIWTSPPCPTHSRVRKNLGMRKGIKAVYPSMVLYEEILFLQGYVKCPYVVENVIGWYEPLIRPQKLGRHYYWSNFNLTKIRDISGSKIVGGSISELQDINHVDLSKYHYINKILVLRNCVESETAKEILDCGLNIKQRSLI